MTSEFNQSRGITLNFKGEFGETIELGIPDLAIGEKFDRWGQVIVQITSNNATLKNGFGIEQSDVQHLVEQLSQVSPNETTEWETMEGNLKLVLKTSVLGNIELSLIINSSKNFCRLANFRMPITIQQVELAISQLQAFLSD